MNILGLFKKALTGASDEDNAKNKARMREIFNEAVPNGDDYQLVYCHSENYHSAVIASVTHHYNFIVGYKTGEVVVVYVDPSLSTYDQPVFFNKENGSSIRTSMGYCFAESPAASFKLEPITYEPGIGERAKYCVSVTHLPKKYPHSASSLNKASNLIIAYKKISHRCEIFKLLIQL